MTEDIDLECNICTENYGRNRMPVEWQCCRQWTCKECAIKQIQNSALRNLACPFCRRQSTMDSFCNPDTSSLTGLFKHFDISIHRKNITGSGLTCSQCLAEKISYEQLFIYFHDPVLIQCHIVLTEERETFDYLVQIAVCSVCLHRSCPVADAPVLSLKDIFFVDEEELVAYSHKFFKSGIQCANEANAMTGAVLCWRWLYAMRCNNVPCDYETKSAIFITKILDCSYWKNSRQASYELTEWRNATDMVILHILSTFTEIFLKKHAASAVVIIFHLAIRVSEHLRGLPVVADVLHIYLTNKILYPTFVGTLEYTTNERIDQLERRYEAMELLIDFECYRNNKDKAADIWAMLRTEFTRCANFESTDCLDFLNKKGNELLIRFFNYLRRSME